MGPEIPFWSSPDLFGIPNQCGIPDLFGTLNFPRNPDLGKISNQISDMFGILFPLQNSKSVRNSQSVQNSRYVWNSQSFPDLSEIPNQIRTPDKFGIPKLFGISDLCEIPDLVKIPDLSGTPIFPEHQICAKFAVDLFRAGDVFSWPEHKSSSDTDFLLDGWGRQRNKRRTAKHGNRLVPSGPLILHVLQDGLCFLKAWPILGNM